MLDEAPICHVGFVVEAQPFDESRRKYQDPHDTRHRAR
jgi:hypothetical protein